MFLFIYERLSPYTKWNVILKEDFHELQNEHFL